MGLSVEQKHQQGLELLAQSILEQATDMAKEDHLTQAETDEMVSEYVRLVVGEINEKIEIIKG